MLRHSTAHVLAQAVLDLWPGAHYAIGPAIADGFYYDFELPGGATFSDDDLERIEEKMRAIMAEDQPFVREEHTVDEGLALFADQPFKREIIEGVAGAAPDAALSAEAVGRHRPRRRGGEHLPQRRRAEHGAGFVDLCRGPHVPSTGRLGHFKLLRVAGAYWRGDEHRPQLQRIYGTAWESETALAEHLHRLEEAERRDHRRLGAELDLFSFPTEIGSGLAVFHPKGATIRRLMEDYSRRRHVEGGYQFVYTPHITKAELFETSGHLDWFAEGMFPPMELDEGQQYYLKPMNCPFHILIYRSRQRSYRELPMRLFEFGTVYRYEKSGVVHGLTRVRGITMDDSHIFCTREQMADELGVAAHLRPRPAAATSASTTSTSSSPPSPRARRWAPTRSGTRPPRRCGWWPRDAASSSSWTRGAAPSTAPRSRCRRATPSGGTGRCPPSSSTSKMPQRFGLEYVGADNARHRPVMIHRALFGSVERFFAILLEHYAGALPTWLMPVQVVVLPVRDDHDAYARRRGRRAARRRRAGRGRPRRRAAQRPHPPGEAREGALHPGRGRRRRRGRHRGGERPGVASAPIAGRGARRLRRRAWRPRSTTKGVARDGGRRSRPVSRHERVSLEQLWAGWRHEYVASATDAERRGDDDECVFCRIAASGPPSAENGVVWRSELSFAVLNAYPYASGHLLVMPVRHVAELDELTAEESADLWDGDPAGRGRHRRRLRPRRHQHGRQPGPGRRGRDPGAPPPARAAPVVGGHQLHDVGGRRPGHARVAGGGVGAAPRAPGRPG